MLISFSTKPNYLIIIQVYNIYYRDLKRKNTDKLIESFIYTRLFALTNNKRQSILLHLCLFVINLLY